MKKQITYTSGLLALSICLLTACSNPSKVINASEPSVPSQSSAATPQPAAPDKSNEKDHAAAFLGVWTQDNPRSLKSRVLAMLGKFGSFMAIKLKTMSVKSFQQN